jgi:pilus assembly protein CpaC
MKYLNRTAVTRFVLSLICATFAGGAAAQPGSIVPDDSLVVPLFKSRVVQLDEPAARVSVGNPDVADILILRATQLYVLGKDLGTTNVLLWDRNDHLVGTVAVEVTHDLDSLKEKLHNILPEESIEVFAAQRSIVLRGSVSSSSAADTAVRMAQGYLAQIQTAESTTQFEQEDQSRREDKTVGQIINLLQVRGAQQVMLEVKVAEIARSELKRLDAQFNAFNTENSNWVFGGVNGGATFPDVVFEEMQIPDGLGGTITIPGGRRPVFDRIAPWGPAIDEFAPTPMTIQDQGLFASLLTDNFLFNLAIDAAKEKGLAKILAEPTLTTLTGQEAHFLSGGEFPIPVPQGNDGITIEYKEFGVLLRFLPVVLGGGVINVKVEVSVSELVNSNTVAVSDRNTTSSFVIPSLTKRSADVNVELKDGQTIGIAGLINQSLREVVTKFPGLGELPVLGALFRSQSFINNESELVIMVTPRLAKPLSPGDIRLPTDKFVEPSDTDFYLLGRTEGRAKPEQPHPEGSGMSADYGHQIN